MQKILVSIQQLFTRLFETICIYPATSSMALLATAISSYMIEHDIALNESSAILALLMGLPLFFAVESTVLIKNLDRKKRGFPLYAGAFCLLGLYYFYVRGDRTQNFVIRYFQLSLIAHLVVSFLPFLNFRSEDHFWKFNNLLVIRFLEAFLYTLVLYVGLLLALLSGEELLGLDPPRNLYFFIWTFCTFLFHPLLFLAKLPIRPNEAFQKMTYPKGLQYFVQYLLIPLVTLFTLILYAYMAKILFSVDWPEGYLGWLISVISVLGVLNLLLLEPLKKSVDWIKSYAKIFYLVMLPLLVLLFVAVFKRVSAYGLTEKRYALVVFGLLLAGLMLYFLLSSSKNIKAIPMALAGLLAITLFGPLSPYEISRKSQMEQVRVLLEKNQLLKDGKAVKGKKVEIPIEDAKRISNILDYLVKFHEPSELEGWFPRETLEEVWGYYGAKSYKGRYNKTSHALMDYLGVQYRNRWERDYSTYFNLSSTFANGVLPIRGDYAYLIKTGLSVGSEQTRNFLGNEVSLSLGTKKPGSLIVEVNGESEEIPVLDLAVKLLDLPPKKRSSAPQKIFEKTLSKACQCKVIFTRLTGNADPRDVTLESIEVVLLMSEKGLKTRQ